MYIILLSILLALAVLATLGLIYVDEQRERERWYAPMKWNVATWGSTAIIYICLFATAFIGSN